MEQALTNSSKKKLLPVSRKTEDRAKSIPQTLISGKCLLFVEDTSFKK